LPEQKGCVVNATPPARSSSFVRRALHSQHPTIHWKRYGLASSGFWRAFSSQSRYESLPRPERFRLALEETGGLFETFGRFLAGRADLLGSTYLTQLANLRSSRKPACDPSSLPEISGKVQDLALLGFSPVSEIYSGTFSDRGIVVEIFSDRAQGNHNSGWRKFTKQIRRLADTPEGDVAGQDVLDQFREWLDWQGDINRKRSLLRNLTTVPFSTTTRFPKLIDELQSERCLVYEKQSGDSLPEKLRSEKSGALAIDLWTESLLEQALLLSLIDSEARPENYLLLTEGGIGFNFVPAFITIPVEWHNEMVQYTASAAAGNSQRAIQMLSRICASESAYDVEQRLLERLSALQPELKIQQSIPESVVTIENYWRSLRTASVASPLFLHLYHRNMSIVGQWTGISASEDDPVAGGLWPTLGRLLQFRLGELVSSEKGLEWLYSSGLLLMSATRQIAITLEQVRDNDIALLVEGPDDDTREDIRTRRVASAIRSALALGLLLLSAEIARQTSGTLSAAATTAAAVSAAALCAVIARIK
jgi:hypothetical protein